MKVADISDADVVQAVAEYQRHTAPPFPHEILARRFGCAEKVAYRAVERAGRHGLIEYGVSLRTGWLTDAGEGLLQRGGPAT